MRRLHEQLSVQGNRPRIIPEQRGENIMVKVTIDGVTVEVPENYTVIEAAALAGIRIPQLCYHPELSKAGACRVCMVEIEGARNLGAACVYPVADGMVVHTNTPLVRETRKTVVELLLANHDRSCLTCQKNNDCELQKIAADLGIREIPFEGAKRDNPVDDSNPSLVRTPNKCILCGRCIRACAEHQGLDVYGFINRGFNTVVGPAFNLGLGDVACSLCGQCSAVCPTAAITEKDDTEKVFDAIGDPEKFTVVQTAPAVRVALGEALGIPAGEIVTGKMVAALRKLGFDKVYDTNFSADLTIMEEGTEFLHRVKNGGVLPMITSCSPGWINFIEMKYPDLLDHLSTAKSPQGMFGAVMKTYEPERLGIPVEKIYSVSIMPCTAKKSECVRPQLQSNPGIPDVDAVLTTRELARMIKNAGIDFKNLPEEEYDDPMGTSTGAAAIFGVTGGVMEAAIRTVYAKLTGKELDGVVFTPVRGMEGIKEASVDVPVDGKTVTVKLAVAHTLKNARILMDKVRAGEADYHFIEIMACPGGCIGGGGQPQPVNAQIRAARTAAIYRVDETSTLRQSHNNPQIKEIYAKFFGEPCGEKSHKLLHTHYTAQKREI